MQPLLRIGILTHPSISFTLKDSFLIDGCEQILLQGSYTALFNNNSIQISGNGIVLNATSFLLKSDSTEAGFVIHNVKIGIQFHWERHEDQEFKGALQLLIDDNNVVAINHTPIEEYLTSVISSEMSATSSLELLKAHAVISRSWVMAQIDKNLRLQTKDATYQSFVQTEQERTCWYDREDHTLFDVCADDHCQRYQGIQKANNPAVVEAINNTYGLVLTYDNAICDARFSKCCGGVSERFENCWEPVEHPYLVPVRDLNDDSLPDLTTEQGAREWITGNPPAFCNTNDARILSQVLNNYDQETTRFFRWTVDYTQDELSRLAKERSGIDFGDIIDLQPLERGASGRITRLKIIGTKITFTIGKELEIRKTLSTTHLYSSAFVVDKTSINNAIRFTLRGAGWGHGVGLCQIGAAVMGDKGYSFEQILMHYFKHASLTKRY